MGRGDRGVDMARAGAGAAMAWAGEGMAQAGAAVAQAEAGMAPGASPRGRTEPSLTERDKGFVLLPPTLQPCAAAAGSGDRQQPAQPRAPTPRRRAGASPPLSAPGESGSHRGRRNSRHWLGLAANEPTRHGQRPWGSQGLHDGNPTGERPGRAAAARPRPPAPRPPGRARCRPWETA